MFSYVLSSASSYFYLPIDDDEDTEDTPQSSKHISWDSDSDSSFSPSPSSSSSSLHSQYGPPPPLKKNKAVINEILSENDLYRILGVSRSSRVDKLTLRRAYLARSKACHPDKFPNNPEATRAFQKVSLAYDVLSTPSSKRTYDSRAPNAAYDLFATRPCPPPDETFRSVVLGVFNDLLDGDLEMIRTMLRAVNDMNPALRLGDDGIDSVLRTLEAIRERALTCRTCILALHAELSRLLEVQRAFRELSYFDLRRRSALTVRLARLTVALPIALEHALRAQRADYAPGAPRDGVGVGDRDRDVLINRRVATLLRGIVLVLERMERVLG